MRWGIIFALLIMFSCEERKIKIAAIGDSLTRKSAYLDVVRKNFPDAVVHDYGVGSEGTQHIMKRVRVSGSDLSNKIVGITDYDIIVILAGINNITRPDDVISDLSLLYEAARINDVEVIGITLLPWKRYKPWTPKKQEYTDKINRWIMFRSGASMCVPGHKIFVDEEGGLRKEFDNGDGLHINKAGQKHLGLYVSTAISRIIKYPYYIESKIPPLNAISVP